MRSILHFLPLTLALRATLWTILVCGVGLAASRAEAGCAGVKQGCGWPIQPACCGSLKCELTAWPPECRHSPPRESEACTIFSGCSGSNLYCKGFQDGLAGRCTEYSRLGDACDGVLTLCGEGLKCRQDPRNLYFSDPATFGDGRCFADVPGEYFQFLELGLDWDNDDACLAVYSPSVHRNLPVSRLPFGETHAMTFGSGWAGQAGVAGSWELGGIYGDDGSFACYRQQCAGGGILGLAKFVTIAEYQDSDSASNGIGFQVSGGGAVILGYNHAVLWDVDPNDPNARPVGEASVLSFGAQVGPDAQLLVCSIDANVVVENWRVVTDPAARCRDVEVCAATDTCLAQASVDAGSTASDGGEPTLSQIPSGPYAIGEQQVTLSVSDGTGGTAQCSAVVDINDCTPPAITCPAPMRVESDAHQQAMVTPAAAQVTDCTSTSVKGPAAGNYPRGTTGVTYTAADVYDNSASCSTSITVVRRRCDFNDDGKVDSLDMRGLMSSLGDPTLKEAGDVNFDGRSGVQEWVTCFGRIAAKRR